MKYILHPFKVLWRIWFMLTFVLTFIILFPLFKVALSRKKWFGVALFLKRVVSGSACLLSGVYPKLINGGKIDWSKTYVIVANHTSYMDVVVSYLVIPKYYHFMGKNALSKVPLFNIFFKRMNIPVDRKSIRSGAVAYQRASSDLAEGISMFMFPEGTIPDHAPQLKRFKPGAFKLAIENGTPILPLVFLDNWKIFPDKNTVYHGGKPGLTRAVVHEPISTEGLTESDAPQLMAEVYGVIENTLKEYKTI